MIDREIETWVSPLAQALRQRGQRMATAESCTGGLIAAACTSLAGSSDWFERGFVTYSNAAKQTMLGVPEALLVEHGAVSQPVAEAMALGALTQAPVEWAVAVTGIAGPGGAVPGKPVGTVWLSWAQARPQGAPAVKSLRLQCPGDRAAVRRQTVRVALQTLLAEIHRQPGGED